MLLNEIISPPFKEPLVAHESFSDDQGMVSEMNETLSKAPSSEPREDELEWFIISIMRLVGTEEHLCSS